MQCAAISIVCNSGEKIPNPLWGATYKHIFEVSCCKNALDLPHGTCYSHFGYVVLNGAISITQWGFINDRYRVGQWGKILVMAMGFVDHLGQSQPLSFCQRNFGRDFLKNSMLSDWKVCKILKIKCSKIKSSNIALFNICLLLGCSCQNFVRGSDGNRILQELRNYSKAIWYISPFKNVVIACPSGPTIQIVSVKKKPKHVELSDSISILWGLFSDTSRT